VSAQADRKSSRDIDKRAGHKRRFGIMVAPQNVRIPSHGEQLAAYLYRPESAQGNLPCVVMAHGFSATRDDGLPAYAEAFRRRVCRPCIRLPAFRCVDRRAAPAARHRPPAR
jgi:hypothetical protein